MQLTVKQPMTVKEYAAEQHIAQQTVYKKISRNANKLKNHVFKMNGKTCLDDTAQELLKPNLENAPLVDKVKRLEEEIVRQKAETEKWYKEYQIYSDNSGLLIREADQYKKRIADLEQELTAEKAKTAADVQCEKSHPDGAECGLCLPHLRAPAAAALLVCVG